MIQILDSGSEGIIAVKMSGKLHEEDYRTFIPLVEGALKSHENVSLLAQFENFEGWDLAAAWEDLKFGAQHYNDFERIALVGENQWQEWMAKVCKPFTRATVKYFSAKQSDEALAWLRESS